MNDYRPSKEVLRACNFTPAASPNEWCHMVHIHMHYFEVDHAVEVYNGEVHPHIHLASRDDADFRAEIEELLSI